MKRNILALSLLCACAVASCTSTGENPSNEVDPTGVYTLVAVDGQTVPAVVAHGDHDVKVYSGAFTIRADGTCSSKTVFSAPTGTPNTREVDATYTQQGSRLDMTWKGAGRTRGTVEGDTFTMNNEGMLFTYER